MVKRFIYNKKVAPYVFILPFIIIFLVFFISPMARTIIMSFQSVLPGITEWVGFDNYSRLLGDKVFLKAIMNSMKYMLWTLVLLIPIPMLLATVLNSKFAKGREFFKSALYLPALTSVVVAGTIFRLAFSELDGAVMNSIIGFFGMDPIKWLKGAGTGFFALLLLACWRWTGVNMLYFLSGLKNIPNKGSYTRPFIFISPKASKCSCRVYPLSMINLVRVSASFHKAGLRRFPHGS